MSMQVDLAVEAPSGLPEEPVATTLLIPLVDKSLVTQLVGQALASGLAIDGENGLLAELTKLVVASAFEGEWTVARVRPQLPRLASDCSGPHD